jgi:hypothetical protein
VKIVRIVSIALILSMLSAGFVTAASAMTHSEHSDPDFELKHKESKNFFSRSPVYKDAPSERVKNIIMDTAKSKKLADFLEEKSLKIEADCIVDADIRQQSVDGWFLITLIDTTKQLPIGFIRCYFSIGQTAKTSHGYFSLLMVHKHYRKHQYAKQIIIPVALRIFNRLDIKKRRWTAEPQDKTTTIHGITKLYQSYDPQNTKITSSDILQNNMEWEDPKIVKEETIKAKL